MKKSIHVILVLALAGTLAYAQTSAPSRPADPAEGQSTPGTAGSTTGANPNAVPSSPNQGKTPASTVDDNTLRQQVQQQLNTDPTMKGVQATVQNGVVDLSGTVANKDDRKKAKKLVGAIPGVRKVREHLTVNSSAGSSGGSNEPTEAKGSNAAFPTTSGTTASSSSPSAPTSGQSTTSSASSSPSAASGQSTNTAGSNAGNTGAADASASASSTPKTGATHGVISGSSPQSSGTASAQAGAGAGTTAHGSAADVEKAINSQISGAHVQVKEKNKNLVLTGSVPRDSDRAQAENIAATVAGPRTVIDQLETAAGGASAGAGANASVPQSSATGTAGTSGAQTSATTSGQTAGATTSTGQTAGATTGVSGQTGTTAGTTSATGTAGTSAGQTGTTAGATTGAIGQTGAATGASTGATGAGAPDATLQQQIQAAIQSEPTLASDRVTVNVAGDTIDVTGNVNSGRERQAALRIAQSYAGNRRVNDRLTVNGVGPANNGMAPAANTPGTSSTAPASNTPGATSTAPAANTPGATSTTPATGSPMSTTPSNPNSTPPQTPRQ